MYLEKQVHMHVQIYGIQIVKAEFFQLGVIFVHIEKKQPGKEANQHEGDIETNQ